MAVDTSNSILQLAGKGALMANPNLKDRLVIFLSSPQTDSLEEKNNERNRAESHKLSGIGEKDPEEKQEQLPPLKKSSPTSQQQSQQARVLMNVQDTFRK